MPITDGRCKVGLMFSIIYIKKNLIMRVKQFTEICKVWYFNGNFFVDIFPGISSKNLLNAVKCSQNWTTQCTLFLFQHNVFKRRPFGWEPAQSGKTAYVKQSCSYKIIFKDLLILCKKKKKWYGSNVEDKSCSVTFDCLLEARVLGSLGIHLQRDDSQRRSFFSFVSQKAPYLVLFTASYFSLTWQV